MNYFKMCNFFGLLYHQNFQGGKALKLLLVKLMNKMYPVGYSCLYFAHKKRL